MSLKRIFLLAGVAFALFVAWAIYFALHLSRPPQQIELDDFLATRGKVRRLLAAHANTLPEGMTSQSGGKNTDQMLFPPDSIIRNSVASTGHWAQTVTDQVMIALDKESVAVNDPGLVAQQIADHFSQALKDEGPAVQRTERAGPFTNTHMQALPGLNRSAHSIDSTTAMTTIEQLWSSRDGAINLLLRVSVQKDPPQAKVTWYIIERF